MYIKESQLDFRALDEALQQAQLDKVSRMIDLDPSEILQRIALVDPTVDRAENAMNGKYAQWLVARLVQSLKDDKQAEWIRKNPMKAYEQGLLPQTLPSDIDPENKAAKQDILYRHSLSVSNEYLKRSDDNMWIYGHEDELHDALSRFDQLSERNWLTRAGIPSDINQHKNIREFIDKLEDLGGPIEYVIENPGELDFSVEYKDDRGVYILSSSDPDTVMRLGDAAGWCFGGDKTWARTYTENGPVFIVHVPLGTDLTGLTAKKSTVFLDMLVAVAVSPHSRRLPDGDEVSEGQVLEIRDARNEWLEPSDLEHDDLLDPVVEVIQDYREDDPEAAQGFDTWLAAGTFTIDDVDINVLSAIAQNVVSRFRLDYDRTDGEVEVSFDLNDFGDMANYRALADNAHREYDNLLFFDGTEEDWGTWEAITRHLEGELVDVDIYNDVISDAQENVWHGGGAERIRHEIAKWLQEYEDEFGPPLGVPADDWVDFMDVDVGDILILLENADYELFDVSRSSVDVNTDWVEKMVMGGEESLDALRKALDVPSARKLELDREVTAGQQFFPFASPKEFKFDEDARAAMRRVILGRTR